MNMNEMAAVNQLITTNLNINKFIEIYFNALLVVQKRYTCTTVFFFSALSVVASEII